MTCRLPLRGYLHGIGPRHTRMLDAGTKPRSRFVVAEMNWSDAQPTQADNDNYRLNALGLANLEECLAMDYDMVKLRLFTGDNCPQWAKDIGAGPMSWADTDNTYSIPVWWDADYLEAYRKFVVAVSLILRTKAKVVDVTIAGCTSVFSEPMIRQTAFSANRVVAQAAGYTEAIDVEAIKRCIDVHHAYMSPLGIASSMAANPFQVFTQTGSATRLQTTYDLLEYQFARLGKYAVWANHSLAAGYVNGVAVQKRPEANYISMYDYLGSNSWRVPVIYQTATMASIVDQYGGTIDACVQWAIDRGAIGIEMPWGRTPYLNWTDNSLMTVAKSEFFNSEFEVNRMNVR